MDLKIELVTIPASSFLMGSRPSEIERCVGFWKSRLLDHSFTEDVFRSWILKEFPAHPVQLASFRIGKYPVTNRQYKLFCSSTGHALPESLSESEPEDHPAWGMEHGDAQAFARWAGEQLGFSCSLPSEEQWEFSARGFSRSEYPYGNEFSPKKANTAESGIGKTTPVDRYAAAASEFGVCDLAGNVEEWTSGRYRPYPGGSFIADDLINCLGRDYPVLRGGSFARGGDLSRGARRHGKYRSSEYKYTGFRIACDPMQEDHENDGPKAGRSRQVKITASGAGPAASSGPAPRLNLRHKAR